MSWQADQQRRREDERQRAFRRAEIDGLQKQLMVLQQAVRNLEAEFGRVMFVSGQVVEVDDDRLMQVGVYSYSGGEDESV